MYTVEENYLDVTLLAPREKHPTIFARFDALNGGERLNILNDHDPKPLYYQLLGERGNGFTWEYLEQGPEIWRVCITKNPPGVKESSLGEIAAKDIRKAEVFKKYGLDFCCGGKKTVKEACAEKGLDVTAVEQELQEADKNPETRPMAFSEWKPDFLADYIVNIHHSYVLKSLPDLQTYGAKVAAVHGAQHPELIRVNTLIRLVASEMLDHMEKEEKILFPFIKHLQQAADTQTPVRRESFNTVLNPITMMESEHEMVGQHLAEIRSITGGYKLPSDACASYAFLFNKLQEFENDLFTHIHLENNILFPQALQLEKTLS